MNKAQHNLLSIFSLSPSCRNRQLKADSSRGDNSMPNWLTFITLLLALGFLSLQIYLFSGASIKSDGYSYFNAWESIKGGHTDFLRTPVYAIIVGILTEIFNQPTALIIIPILHWLLYLAMLCGVWQINTALDVKKSINCGVILSLMLIPGFWCMNNFTMAECLSQAGTIFLVWLSSRYILNPHQRWLYLSGLTLPLLLFTKPIFIILIPLMALFWGIICRHNKKHLKICSISIATTIGLAGVYLFCMAHTYTRPSFTIATAYNEYYCMRAEGLIIPDEIEDSVLREKFRPMYDSIPGGWLKTQPYWQEIWKLNWQELDALAKTARKNHLPEIAESTVRRFCTSLNYSLFYSLVDELGVSKDYDQRFATWNGLSKNQDGGFIYPFHQRFNIPIWFGVVILFSFIAVWIFHWYHNRHFPALAALISAFFLSAYVTTIVGAQDSWGRILTPFSPLLAIMAGSLISIAYQRWTTRKISSLDNC